MGYSEAVPKPGHGPAQRPRGERRLSDAECRAARPDSTIRTLSDGKALYLAVMPNGSKLWRFKYRHGGKERIYSIGAYDEVGLSAARTKCEEARGWLRDGKDPVAERKTR